MLLDIVNGGENIMIEEFLCNFEIELIMLLINR